ncbi:MAG: LysM domain-containing protein [Anaerolineales bacterium]
MRSLGKPVGITLAAALVLFGFWAVSTPGPALGAMLQTTPEPMPSAGADGRILYTVLPNDTQWGIAAQFGMELTTLQNLNSWNGNEVLGEGQVILLGITSQQEATTPTADPPSDVVATLTPETPGTGSICVLLFDDVNGDAARQETEFGIAGGQASVNERAGLASRTAATVSALDEELDPVRTCFEELPLGEYTISVAIPEGYNPTTAPNITIQIAPGQTQEINFGAQVSSAGGGSLLSTNEGQPSPIMGLLGILLLLSGAGLGFYTLQVRRR